MKMTMKPSFRRKSSCRCRRSLCDAGKVHTGPNGQKRIYSGNNCFSQMVVCGECGELYRRVHWNNHGRKSIVWRCISRLEPSRAAMNCISRTVKEYLLQEVTVKAFNRVLTDSDGFLRQMQENIAKAIMAADTMSPDGIQARLDEPQKELIRKATSKQGLRCHRR